MAENLVKSLARRAGRAADGVAGVFENSVRLGVTGLSRAGKTVFITSLVSNLMDRGRMAGFVPANAITAAYLQPQPDDTVPRFNYETHLAALTGADPFWPESTSAVSQLRLSFRTERSGVVSGIAGPRILHLDIIDYPGEWLLDLGLMDQTYSEWSGDMHLRLSGRIGARDFIRAAQSMHDKEVFEESDAQSLARLYTAYLQQARASGLSDCSPGRFLLPGELAGAPVLTFAPLPRPETPARKGLWREMERRYDAYKRQVVRPFFVRHFAKIDRQVVLMDVLGVIHNGPEAIEDLRRTMAGVLSAFRPGSNRFLRQVIHGRRVDRILFAATKADHIHHAEHDKLTAITETMLREAKDRAEFSGAKTQAVSLAALRTTVEEEHRQNGMVLPCVRGRVKDKQIAVYPGDLPDDPAQIVGHARGGASEWLHDYDGAQFDPAKITTRAGFGLPHIRMDRAAQFLLGDKF